MSTFLPAVIQVFDNTKLTLSTRSGPNTWDYTRMIYDGDGAPQNISSGASDPRNSTKLGVITEDEYDPGSGNPPDFETLRFFGDGVPTDDLVYPLFGSTAQWDNEFNNTSYGAWFYNNAYWLINLDPNSGAICVSKSTDGGTTWTQVDTAHQPGVFIIYPNYRYDPATHKIYVFTDDSSLDSTFFLYTFDLATELWTGPFGTYTGVKGFNGVEIRPGNQIFPFPNGDIGVMYAYPSFGSFNLYYNVYSAGSGTWGVEQLIVSGIHTYIQVDQNNNCIMDPGLEKIHLFTRPHPSNFYEYRTVDHDGTVSAVIFTFPDLNNDEVGIGHSIICNSEIFVPFGRENRRVTGLCSVWVAPLSTGQFVEEVVAKPTNQAGRVLTAAYMVFVIQPDQRTKPGVGGQPFPRYLPYLGIAPLNPPKSSWWAPPNEASACLARDYTDFHKIDRTILACPKRPDCGQILEPDWVDRPAGAIQFNKSGHIVLPAPASGDTVVMSTRVPFGYDGILVGQFHLFTQPFDEGSGDLIWRVRVNGRYLRDMGQMLSQFGSLQNLSPCPGGLWLYSGNLIEYIVSAPNTGGSLPTPGQGQVITGLNGWFFPRK